MPNTKNQTPLANLPVVDLAYAVERLVAGGKTTTAEVLALAADRGKRIALLEAELRALRGGGVGRAPTTKAGRPVRKARPAAKKARKPAPAAKPVAKPATAPAKPRYSPKLRNFRRVQGLYAGYLRGFTGATRERIRTINAEKGPAAALAEMKKPANHGASAKVAAKAAPAKPSSLNTFRKLQGKYMGLLRNFTGPVRERIKGIAKAQKFPAAIAEMKKLLAGKGAPTKVAKAAPAKKVAPNKPKVDPTRAAARKLQGTYIGLLRTRPEAEKAKLKALAKAKGFAAAIEVMKRAAK